MTCIIFDLDGTLLDTSPGILESIQYASETFGYPQLSQEEKRSFIGPPLRESFMRCYGCSREEAEKLTSCYRDYYRNQTLLRAKPYDGILELCAELRDQGLQIAVATAKPQIFAERILNHFGFNQYISIIHGADLEGKLKKSDLIRLVMEESGADRFLMIGDTEHDAKGAFEAGVPFLAVSYGFGSQEEMRNYPQVGVAEKPMDILQFL